MRLAAALLSVFAIALPVRAEDWRPPSGGETALFVAAELLIAVDVLQTRDWMRRCPPPERAVFGCEANPLLGPRPSEGRIIATGAGAMLVTAAAWYFLPPPWRNLPSTLVLFVELPNVTHNAIIGMRTRF